MVPLKWGDALSTILPGAIALVGLRAFIPTIDDWLKQLTVSGSSLLVGGALLVAAAVVGGDTGGNYEGRLGTAYIGSLVSSNGCTYRPW